MLREFGGQYTRDESVDAYEHWLDAKLAARDPAVCAEMNRLYQKAKAGSLALGCFCKKRRGARWDDTRCHGDVVRARLLGAFGRRDAARPDT